MDDVQVGAALRAIRLRRGLRQVDVAGLAGCSHPTISRVERGHVGELTLDRLRAAAAALDARVVLDVRWRGVRLPRLIDERHAVMQQTLGRRLAALAGWQFAPEASFSVYGERGSVDLLGWHAQTQTLLVVELKSELVDLQDLLATLDRKRRLAPTIARERGWRCRTVGTWVVLEEGRENRRRVGVYGELLRRVCPADGRAMRRWLLRPEGPIGALSFLTVVRGANGERPIAPRSRVSRRTPPAKARSPCSDQGPDAARNEPISHDQAQSASECSPGGQ